LIVSASLKRSVAHRSATKCGEVLYGYASSLRSSLDC